MLPTMTQLRLTVRRLQRAPLFSLTVITILGLSVGAATLMFSAFYAIKLRPLPFRDSDALVQVWGADDVRGGWQSQDLFDAETLAAWQAAQSRLASFTAYHDVALTPHTGITRTLSGLEVDGQFFSTLGVNAMLGRPITAEDDVPGAPPVLVLSDQLWHSAWAAEPGVIGRTWRLNTTTYVIVGVMPPGVDLIGGEAWVSAPGRYLQHDGVYTGIGRLKPGVTMAAVQAQLSALVPHALDDKPGAGRRGALVAFLAHSLRGVNQTLTLFVAAAGLLLAVAIANLGTLFLVRILGRLKQTAISTALGATRARLRADIMLEGALLGLVAAGVGLLGAAWARMALQTFISDRLTGRADALPIGAPVVMFALIIGVVAGATLALGPHSITARLNVLEHLRGGGAGSSTGGRQSRWRRVLVGLQVSIALLASVAAAALVRSSHYLAHVDVGYDAEHLLVTPLEIWNTDYGTDAGAHALVDRIERELASVPGLGTPAIWATSGFPMPKRAGELMMTAEGSPIRMASDGCTIAVCAYDIHPVNPDLFATIGIPLKAGRWFGSSDRAGSVPVAIINEQAATAWWPGTSAVGKRIRIGGDSAPGPWLTVVGVVATTAPLNPLGRFRRAIRQSTLQPLIFEPVTQATLAGKGIANNPLFVGVHVTRDPGAIARTLQLALHRIMPDLEIPAPQPMPAIDAGGYGLGMASLVRLHASVALTVTAIAVLLAMLGITGVVAESVRSRTRELGVRMALGATSPGIVRLICAEALRWIAAGVTCGVLGTLVLSRIGGAIVFGSANRQQPNGNLLLGPQHPAALVAAVAAIILGIGLIAAYGPARHASRLDPLVALRSGNE